jgi:hypothetical protein
VALAEGDATGLGAGEVAGDVLAAGEAPGLGDTLGLGEGDSVTVATELLWLRLRPMGTTTIPSAVTMRKLTAPHSRRRKSLFREPPCGIRP